MRDGFVFYRSFYEAINELPDENFKKVVCAICRYALYGDEPLELSMIEKSIFLLVKPQIDANERRRQNGCNGGAPRDNQNAKKQKENNQESTEKQPKDNQLKIEVVSETEKIDFDKLKIFWNTECKRLPKIEVMTSKRKNAIKSIIAEYGKSSLMKAIVNASKSDFMAGHNSRRWVATFDWLLLKNNFVKVLENNYSNHERISDNGTKNDSRPKISKNPDDFPAFG